MIFKTKRSLADKEPFLFCLKGVTLSLTPRFVKLISASEVLSYPKILP